MNAPPASLAQRSSGPLRRSVGWRVALTAALAFAVLAAVLGSLYSTQQRRGAQQLLIDAERHYLARTRQINAEWVRQAELLRGQIEFSGLLDGDDRRVAAARFTAFLSNMGGQGPFTHLLLADRADTVMFRFATRTGATLQPGAPAPLSWTYSPEDRLVYRTLRAPIRLGTLGEVWLLLFAPVDNALLGSVAFPDTFLSLHWQGQADLATSYRGDSPHGSAPADGLRLEGGVDWAGEPDSPRLHVVRDVQSVMPLTELLLLLLGGTALAGGLAWLVLGRWAGDHMRRLGVLSESTARFAAARTLTPQLSADLEGASDRGSNELFTLGHGLQSLMQDVTEAERAQARAQDNLRELNATLEQRVVERTRDLAQARDEALAGSRAREQFLAAMSHELRTPLAGLLGGLELIEIDQLPTAQRTLLGVARRSGDALRSVIDGVLDYAKLESGTVSLNDQVFRPDEVVRDAVSLFSALALSRGLSLTCHCAPEAARAVRGDPVRLGQVLLNLIGNALKFTDGGTVDVRLAAPAITDLASDDAAPRLRFAVVDSGVGMAPQQLGELFQPFVQVHPGTGAPRGGTGLGLAISQRLVAAMGGRITVESAPGRGSTFAFELALPSAGMQVPATVAPQLPQVLLKGRALVVDDNPVNCIVINAMLSRLGLQVDERADGEQALQALREASYDVVLMDCQMPVLDGPATARLIRSGAAGAAAAALSIIAVTAHASNADAQRCLDAGMDECLTKPFTTAALAAALQRRLGQVA